MASIWYPGDRNWRSTPSGSRRRIPLRSNSRWSPTHSRSSSRTVISDPFRSGLSTASRTWTGSSAKRAQKSMFSLRLHFLPTTFHCKIRIRKTRTALRRLRTPSCRPRLEKGGGENGCSMPLQTYKFLETKRIDQINDKQKLTYASSR